MVFEYKNVPDAAFLTIDLSTTGTITTPIAFQSGARFDGERLEIDGATDFAFTATFPCTDVVVRDLIVRNTLKPLCESCIFAVNTGARITLDGGLFENNDAGAVLDIGNAGTCPDRESGANIIRDLTLRGNASGAFFQGDSSTSLERASIDSGDRAFVATERSNVAASDVRIGGGAKEGIAVPRSQRVASTTRSLRDW